MANLKSTKKDIRRSERRREKNSQQRSAIRTFAKNVLKSVKAGKKDEAKAMLNTFSSLIDKAAKKKILHKKNADRHKSRLALKVNSIK